MSQTLTVTLLTGLALLQAPGIQALEFQCELDNDVRYLRVDIPGEEHLCEVSVRYETTGERKVMWYADFDSLYCSARAYELSDKYRQAWGFDCISWPDRDGIDQLSPTHRGILDLQLKTLMTELEHAEKNLRVIGVRASSSTLLDSEPGFLALQFFLSDGTDRTQIIADDKPSWQVFATIDNLASQIASRTPVDSALIGAISDGATLEVITTVTDAVDRVCTGREVLMVEGDDLLSTRTAHRLVCEDGKLADRSTD
jgi:hypothetical protein